MIPLLILNLSILCTVTAASLLDFHKCVRHSFIDTHLFSRFVGGSICCFIELISNYARQPLQFELFVWHSVYLEFRYGICCTEELCTFVG